MRFLRIDVPQCWQVPRCIRNSADRIERDIGALFATALGSLLRSLFSDSVFRSDHRFRGRRGFLCGCLGRRFLCRSWWLASALVRVTFE